MSAEHNEGPEQFDANMGASGAMVDIEQGVIMLDLAIEAAWPKGSNIGTGHLFKLVQLRNGLAALLQDLRR